MSQTTLDTDINEPFENPHYPLCRCNKSRSGGKAFLISPTDPASCYKANKWLKQVKLPMNPYGVYLQFLSISSTCSKDPQMVLDCSRTFQSNGYFTLNGRVVLERILHCLSAYCPNLGYVQGMSYLVAALLWHSNEIDCFWLFVGLLEDFELRDNFLQGNPGLKKHFHVLEYLISSQCPQVFSRIFQLNLSIQMFATDWLLTLFCNSVPLDYSNSVLSKFFKYGWQFLYKLCVEIVTRLESKILAADKFSDVINLFKIMEGEKGWKDFIKSLAKKREKVNWEKIVKKANEVEVNEWFLNCLKHNSMNRGE